MGCLGSSEWACLRTSAYPGRYTPVMSNTDHYLTARPGHRRPGPRNSDWIRAAPQGLDGRRRPRCGHLTTRPVLPLLVHSTSWFEPPWNMRSTGLRCRMPPRSPGSTRIGNELLQVRRIGAARTATAVRSRHVDTARVADSARVAVVRRSRIHHVHRGLPDQRRDQAGLRSRT